MHKYPILDLCARVEGHPVQHARLREACWEFREWNNLLVQSEQEGLSPLLRKHIVESESYYPETVRRSLTILSHQHENRARVETEVLQDVLQLLQSEKLTPLCIKGAALRHTVYPDPVLRPMRDIDLLMHADEAKTAQDILQSSGFIVSKAPIPPDHFHLPALYKKIGGSNVCVEIHKGLYPDCPPFYEPVNFETLVESAKAFSINGFSALTMGDEDMLQHLYHHGIHTPLTYEACRLINISDLVGLIEQCSNTIDWQALEARHASLLRALPVLHHITPWNPKNIPTGFIAPRELKTRRASEGFRGWPQNKVKEQKSAGISIIQLLRDTFLPSRWWLMIYYGASSWWARVWCRAVRHPRHIFWWIRLHYSYLDSAGPSNPEESSTVPTKYPSKIKALWRKIYS